MKYSFSVILSLICSGWSLRAQDFIILPDSANYTVIGLNDTLDIDYNGITPFPDTASLDIDCDGQMDFQIDMYALPVMFFPPEHHIDIVNLGGTNIEMLNDNEWLLAFRSNDTIQIEPNPDWLSLPRWQILSFHVVGGAVWAGIDGTDSLYVNDMYLLFRKRINSEWAYGWINYSGKAWNAALYLRNFAIENDYCITSVVEPLAKLSTLITLYPNPAQDLLFLNNDPRLVYPILWNVVDLSGISRGQGVVLKEGEGINIRALALPDGLYVIRLQSPFGTDVWYAKIIFHH
jgi:hypothetical protein